MKNIDLYDLLIYLLSQNMVIDEMSYQIYTIATKLH